MAYSLLSLGPPKKRSALANAAGVSSVYTPPTRTSMAAPTPAPSYGQQIESLQGANAAPNFALGTASSQPGAMGASPALGFGFSNLSNPAFSAAAPKAQGGSASFDGQSVDYGSDPILKQVEALVQSQVAAAQAQALGQEKTNLIRYGSSDLVKQVLGNKADEETIKGAENNPFSTVAELGRWNTRGLGNVDSATNRANLFFSSTRARDRGLQEEDYTRKSATTANQLQDVLTNIAQGLLQARQNAQNTLLGAQESAYGRAMNEAMYKAQLARAAADKANQPGPGIGSFTDVLNRHAMDPTYGNPISGGTGTGGPGYSYPKDPTYGPGAQPDPWSPSPLPTKKKGPSWLPESLR